MNKTETAARIFGPGRQDLGALMAYLCSALMLFCLYAPPASAGDRQDATAFARIDKVMSSVKELRAEIDASQFDLERLLERLDYDSTNIVEFVTKQIAYQPYTGALRGPAGTLNSRAGNTLDQSLLLAKLLRDAGYDARILSASSSPPLRDLLFHATNVQRQRVSPVKEPLRFAAAMRAILATEPTRQVTEADLLELVSSSDRIDLEMERNVRKAADFLIDSTRKYKSGVAPQEAKPHAEEDGYYWVQYRGEKTGPWIDAHPGLSGQKSPALRNLMHSRVFAGSIPEDLQHRVRFELFLETVTGGKLGRVPLMQPWERPAANLVDATISFVNAPTNLDQALALIDNGNAVPAVTFGDVARIMAAENAIYVPLFNGSLPDGARFFDMKGNLIDPIAASAPASGLFKALNETTRSAVDALAGGSVAPFTAGQVLVVTLVEPGGRESRYERYLFDRLDPKRRLVGTYELADKNALMASPLVDTNIAILTGEIPQAKVLDLNLELAVESRAMLEWLASASESKSFPKAPEKSSLQSALKVPIAKATRLQLLTLAHLMDAPSRSDFLSFRSRPNIVAITEKIAPGDTRVEGIFLSDIVENSRSILRRAEGKLVPDFERAVYQGTWDTWAERGVFGRTRPSSPESLPSAILNLTTVDSTRVFEATGEPDLALVASIDQLRRLDERVPGESRRGIMRDISDGYFVFTSSDEVLGASIHTWWRVDPATGTTLGMGWDGRGTNVAEFAVLILNKLRDTFLSVKFSQGVISYITCTTAKAILANVEQLMTQKEKEYASAAYNCIAAFAGGLVSPVNTTKDLVQLNVAMLLIIAAAF